MAEKKTTTKKTAPKKTAKPAATDLLTQLVEKRADLSAAIRSHKAGELVNPRVLGSTRRDIARLLTKINAEKREKEA